MHHLCSPNTSQASGNWRHREVCVDTTAQILPLSPGSMQDLHVFPPPVFPSFPSSQGHMVQFVTEDFLMRTHSFSEIPFGAHCPGLPDIEQGAWEESWTSAPRFSAHLQPPCLSSETHLLSEGKTFAFSLECLLLWCVQGQPLRTQRFERTGTMSQPKPNHSCFFSLSLILSCQKPSAFRQWTAQAYGDPQRSPDLFWPNWGYQVL